MCKTTSCAVLMCSAFLYVGAGGCGGDTGLPAGSEGGPCYANDTCDEGLVCASGRCVAAPDCTAGETQPCSCTGGVAGEQTCQADGTWGSCDCSQPGCTAGETQPCSCPGGVAGEQTCQADGTWDACGCPQPGCGDGVIGPTESCDSTALGGHTCESEGFASGDMACDPMTCELDVTGCYACGPDGTPCDSGAPCEVGGQCQGDVCVGVPEDCSGVNLPNECWVAQCNPATGQCEVETGNDGGPCASSDFCTVNKTCLAGVCQGGELNTCGMTSPPPCMFVVCDEPSQSCSFVPEPDSTPCVSSDLCQVNTSCTNGLCLGAPKSCFFSPLSECNDVACNPANGQCEGTPDPAKDGDPCALTGDLCQDGKTCAGGLCLGGAPKDCSHLAAECQEGVCDPTDGSCDATAIPVGSTCPEATDGCNLGTCDANAACQPNPVADFTPCDDFASCTTGDECLSGVCAGTVDPTCTVYFEQDFEACPPGGWVLSPDWECGVPTNTGPTTTVSGTGCLGTVIDGDYSNSNVWATSVADSPPIDLSLATDPTLVFWLWIHSEGSSYDGANLKISTDGGNNFSVLNTSKPYGLTIATEPAWGGDEEASGWQQVTADLLPYQGQPIVLRFAFRSDSSIQDPGVYVDDLSIVEADGIPLNITTDDPLSSALVGAPYSQPLQKIGGTASSQWSIVGGTNHGWLTIDPVTGTLSGTPGAGDAGPVTITVRVEVPSNPTNFHEVTFNLEVVVAVWSEGFEGACPAGWTLLGDWQCGAPTSGPGSARGGVQCLATQLASDYSASQAWATTTASSGAIDLSTATNPQLSFWVWMDTEGASYDGFNLSVSTDGSIFTLLSTVTPAYFLTIAGEPAWGGDQSAAGWQELTADLASYAGSTIFLRFAFHSDSIIHNPGVYIDDLVIAD